MLKPRLKPTTKYEINSSHSTPSVLFTYDALAKMDAFIQTCTTEVGWLGYVAYFPEEHLYYVTDVELFKQNASAATTEIQPETLSSFAEELLMRDNGMELWNSLRLWGHSHVNMGVTPSGQDDSQMKVFSTNTDYFIRVIGNKAGEMKVDVYDFVAGINCLDVVWNVETLEIEKSPIEVELEEELARREELYLASIKTLVEQKSAMEKENLSTIVAYTSSITEVVKEDVKKKVLPMYNKITNYYGVGRAFQEKKTTGLPEKTKVDPTSVTKEWILSEFIQSDIDILGSAIESRIKTEILDDYGWDFMTLSYNAREKMYSVIKSEKLVKEEINLVDVRAQYPQYGYYGKQSYFDY